jgi:hypothetical protein
MHVELIHNVPLGYSILKHFPLKCKSKRKYSTALLLQWLSSRIPPTKIAGEDAGKKEPSYTVGVNKLVQPLWKQYRGALKN